MKNQKEEPKSSSHTTTVDAKDTSAEPGAPGVSETTSRIYEEAASLLAHNRAVLGKVLARSGHTDRAIEHLEVACPEILEYQQNAQGRRDNKSKFFKIFCPIVIENIFRACSACQPVPPRSDCYRGLCDPGERT